MSRMNELYKKMVSFYRGDPQHIQHFVKVQSFARMIGQEEHLDEKTLYILEAAALVHDIGIRPAMEKYGKSNGKLQEEEGPAYAERMLRELGFDKDVIARVSYLVGHHHTYKDIDGLDYQILVEADFLVNFLEDHLDEENIRQSVKKIFKTETGRHIAQEMFYPQEFRMSETWAQDGLQDLEDWIEEQGIYIRQ
ncbi:MAG: HD domain-containing protein [Eubacteriales bacterium]|nr:HD domain-containing protein [Eubacteriales bacterium]